MAHDLRGVYPALSDCAVTRHGGNSGEPAPARSADVPERRLIAVDSDCVFTSDIRTTLNNGQAADLESNSSWKVNLRCERRRGKTDKKVIGLQASRK